MRDEPRHSSTNESGPDCWWLVVCRQTPVHDTITALTDLVNWCELYRMNLKQDVNLHSFVSPDDPTDCTLVVVGGKFLRRLPEVLKRIDGKGFRTADDSFGPDAAIRKMSKLIVVLT